MAAVLLDTHTVIWFLANQPINRFAAVAIARAREERSIYLSPISAWEVGAASRKKNTKQRPYLLGLSPSDWFTFATKSLSARVAPISRQVAIEAAAVPAIYDSSDPGDCFLIATSRIRSLTLVTRDTRILSLAQRSPAYLNTLPC